MNTAPLSACAPSARDAARAFRRQLVLMASLGTFGPLAVLALLYTLAPMPLTVQAAAVLRAANGVAAVVVGLNALAVLTLALARAWFVRKGLPAAQPWQPVTLARSSETA